jgi:AAA domain/Winged helix-turn-helix DNA-binding
MNYSDLYTVEMFRPAKPALVPVNDRRAPRSPALVRPNADGRHARTAIREEEPVEIHRFVHLKRKRKPLRYTIDGVVQRGRIYTLTGRTGDGKTTWCATAALAVATGRSDILGLDVERGRVVYLAIENPDDTVSRFAIAQRFYRIPDSALLDRFFIVTTKATPESVFAALKKLSRSGGFALVIVDTLAAYFDGTDLNDNVAGGNFMRRLRALSTVLGNPAVVVPAHPTKGAGAGSLSPYGAGAIVNEVDGNLTLWRVRDVCRLHWQKVRGLHFAPVYFRFRDFGCDRVLDAKGRRVVMPLLVPYADRAAEPRVLPPPSRPQPRLQHEQHRPREDAGPLRLPDLSQGRRRSARSDDASPDTKLLRAMIADPDGTQQDWATATKVAKSNVNRRLKRLQEDGLVHGADGRWTVTATGTRTV